jgi:epoxyqueuosine reductase
MNHDASDLPHDLLDQIRSWAAALGFTGLGVSDASFPAAASALEQWLAKGWHGEMDFMSRHASLRTDPGALLPGVRRIISVRMHYWPTEARPAEQVLEDPDMAYIARYALGRDYHRALRRRLQQLADKITEQVGAFRYRAFVDSAPVMEKPIAQAAGLGWVGKHTNLIHPKEGSWFFLGELFTDLPLPLSKPGTDHCGTCSRCAEACPTGALDTPYQLDARRCIAYLTIEHKTAIPEDLRPMIGNRIFGCDDCQIVCPHNREPFPGEDLFRSRYALDASSLSELFSWSPEEFETRTSGSAIRRLGYERWMRNIAVAIGNSTPAQSKVALLTARLGQVTDMVDEHIEWALDRQRAGLGIR